jgi:hypothetical protein
MWYMSMNAARVFSGGGGTVKLFANLRLNCLRRFLLIATKYSEQKNNF